jgi:PAS domain-containing protein
MPPNPGSRIEDGIEAQSKGRSEICFHAGIADVRQCTMTFGVLLMNVRDKRTVDRLRAGIALLKREKSQLLQSIAAAPVGLALLDHNQRFVRINAALKVIDGHLANEHIGQTLREVIPEQASALEPLCHEVLQNQKPILNVQISGILVHGRASARSIRQVFTPFVPTVRR